MLRFHVLNTHQQWICRQLGDAGYDITRQTASPDAGIAIQQGVRESLSRADFIIVTGGLGPTSDDLTRDLIAALLGRKLHMDAGILAELEGAFCWGGIVPCLKRYQGAKPWSPKERSCSTIRTALRPA